ncbi:LysR family transcriptional regulator [Agromyces seonyuensis]|uniref:LysR family transcriptional regulator n=1 Tax=Agromyces seonyuensis TaxID=2662446 RepID=A0A6I4NYT3_9MICO|nr:LysR family transcriptional regulator [Agromyces seonyuensis]MWB99321.1 LysR family transcriptional regulator [Agromyces seonyuensis]
MDTRLLEYFVAVVEEGGFTRAAERCFVVQSTVSAGIRALESELGATLFERTSRRVAPTPAGAALIESAREALDAVERARGAVTGGVRGRLRVGIFSNLGYLDLPGLFALFRQRYPSVQLNLTTSPGGTSGLVEELRHGRLDLTFLGIRPEEVPEFDVAVLRRSPIVAVLPVAHPLADRDRVALAELADEPFVDSPPGFGQRRVVERLFDAAGLTRRVTTEVAYVDDVPPFVSAGLGVALLPSELLARDADVVAVPLVEPAEWVMSVATRRHPSPAASALRELMAERLASAD